MQYRAVDYAALKPSFKPVPNVMFVEYHENQLIDHVKCFGKPFFGHFSIFWEICVMHYGRNQTLERGRTRDTNLPKKRRNAQKMVILTKESKNFIKAKLTVSKSYLLGLVCFMIFCILRGDLI